MKTLSVRLIILASLYAFSIVFFIACLFINSTPSFAQGACGTNICASGYVEQCFNDGSAWCVPAPGEPDEHCARILPDGTIQDICRDGCSPINGQPCTSNANSCGMTSSGTYDCTSYCNAETPSDALCAPPPDTPPVCDGGVAPEWQGDCMVDPVSGAIVGCWVCPEPPPPPPPPDPLCDNGSPGPYPTCPLLPPPPPPEPVCSNGSPGPYPDCPLVPSCVPYEGAVCGANACGEVGTYDCYGNCSLPAPVDICGDAGLQCTVDECSVPCDSAAGSSCGANACGDSGTVQCDGSCALPAAVDACPSDGGLQCSVSECSPSCVVNEGNACTRTNSCGESNTGSIQCDGSCSVSAPSDATCPVPLSPPTLSITSDRLQVRKGETVRITWDANTTAAFNCATYGPNFGPFNFTPSVDGDSGTRESAPISAKSEFILECIDPGYGTRYIDTVIVETTGTIEER